MSRSELPDTAFAGFGMGNDLFFDRQQLGALVFQADRAAMAEMGGVMDFLKKTVSVVTKPVTGVVKAVGKGVINAAAEKVGLGPVFKSGTAQVVQLPPAQQQALAAAGAPSFFQQHKVPIIVGGAVVGLGVAFLLLRRK